MRASILTDIRSVMQSMSSSRAVRHSGALSAPMGSRCWPLIVGVLLAPAVQAARNETTTRTRGTEKCDEVLNGALTQFEKRPCGEKMGAAVDRLEEVAPLCYQTEGGKKFKSSHQELLDNIEKECGSLFDISTDGIGVTPAPRVVAEAVEKLRKIAVVEEEKMAKEKDTDQSEVTGLSADELEMASREVANGITRDNPKDLLAVGAVLATRNLADVSGDVHEGGTDVKIDAEEEMAVVTVEDTRAIAEESLNATEEELPLQESPMDASRDFNKVMIQGDMRVPRKPAVGFFQRRGRAEQGRVSPEMATLMKVAAGNPWPQGKLPYCYAPDISQASMRAFEEAVEHVRGTAVKTCIEFTRTEAAADGNRCAERGSLFVQSREAGMCWSDVGYRSGGIQLNLGKGCETKGIAVHELGHALGMDHEQSRPDRDKYVEILQENIKDGMADQFEINPNAYADDPYDYMSIMHYSAFTFSKQRGSKKTIRAKKGVNVDSVLGQSMGLSNLDVKQLGAMYCPLLDLNWLAAQAQDNFKSAQKGVFRSQAARGLEGRWRLVAIALAGLAVASNVA